MRLRGMPEVVRRRHRRCRLRHLVKKKKTVGVFWMHGEMKVKDH